MKDRIAIAANAVRSSELFCTEMLLEIVAVACGVPPVFVADEIDAMRF